MQYGKYCLRDGYPETKHTLFDATSGKIREVATWLVPAVIYRYTTTVTNKLSTSVETVRVPLSRNENSLHIKYSVQNFQQFT